MDVERLNKSVVSRWFACFWGDKFDLSIVDELAAPDVVLQYSESDRLHGRHALRTFMLDFRKAFADLRFQMIGAPIADRDIVVVRWQCSGTHAGPAFHDFNLDALPQASGRRISLSGHTAVRLEDSLIAEEAVWSTERKVRLRAITGGLILETGRRLEAAKLPCIMLDAG